MELYNYYSNGMVIEQNMPFVIKGKNANKELKAILINKKTNKQYNPIKIIINDDNTFIVLFDGISGSFIPYMIIFNDSELILDDIYFGDVFLTAGQSNMSYSLGCVEQKEKYKELLKDRHIFVLNILEKNMDENGFINRPFEKQKDIAFKWNKVTEDNIYSISALSIMFAINMSYNHDYPIGIICSAIGGCSIDTYLPYEICINDKIIYRYLVKTGKLATKENYNTFGISNYTQTAGLFNEKIAPIIDLNIKAIIWYQGENSAFDFESAIYYKHALTVLIKQYRKLFKDDNLPFIITGIADEYYMYGDSYGYLYIQEVLSQIKLKNTYYVPIFDIYPRWQIKDGNNFYHPIHPVNKEEIVKRYEKIIENNIYNKEKFYFPYVKKVIEKENKLLLKIDLIGKGFRKNQSFFGFTISSIDNVYYEAKAIAINNDTIELSSRYVDKPLYYTYGLFQYSYLANCKTKDNYPLSISRSKFEDIKKSKYLLNIPILSAKFEKLMLNNFGTEVGGGFDYPLFEKGKIFNNNIIIKKKKEGIIAIYKNKNNNYNYFAIKINLAIPGLKQNLSDFKYIVFDLKGNEYVELHGILFQYKQFINKLSLVNKNNTISFTKINDKINSYYISLDDYLDGSEGKYNTTKEMLDNITSVELYFRSFKDATICLNHIYLSNEIVNNANSIDNNKNNIGDTSMYLPNK